MLAVPDPGHRPFAVVVVWWSLIVAIEATLLRFAGTSMGKAMCGLRVIELDEPGRCSTRAALRRPMFGTALELFPPIGWVLLGIAFMDPLGRGGVDRSARTIVVRRHTPQPVRSRELAHLADLRRPPRIIDRGRVGDLDVRVRARLRRLDDSPLLIATVALLALTVIAWEGSPLRYLLLSAIWIVLFVVDETVRLSRHGQTPGHRLAGLMVLDRRTGAPPSRLRSLVRATVLALSAYTIVGFPILGISALMIRIGRTGRGIHDVFAGTVVVADPTLDPEVARQRAMRIRTGEVA